MLLVLIAWRALLVLYEVVAGLLVRLGGELGLADALSQLELSAVSLEKLLVLTCSGDDLV